METLIKGSQKLGIGSVTLYQIEVRASAEQYDVQAQQVAREILKLPGKYLPSLAAISTSPSPLTIRTSQLYYFTGQLTPTQLNHLSQQLLLDPVTQEIELSQKPENSVTAYIVDIFFHPGVTDTLAESVLTGASMLGITTLEHVETGRRYILDNRLSEEEVSFITNALLYNPVIQNYVLRETVGVSFLSPSMGQVKTDQGTGTRAGASPAPTIHEMQITFPSYSRGIPLRVPSEWGGGSATDVNSTPIGAQFSAPSLITNENVEIVKTHHVPAFIPLSEMTEQQLMELSKSGLLALNLDEMRTIQQHYKEQRREPTDVELETLAQTWSEHCSHKTFKATIHYQELDGDGKVFEQETIHGLLKQYIMRATQHINHPWMVSAFSDNAGIVRFTETQDIAFKVETHNHPSAIEPFGGANTGVGGVIRDVLGVSAQPIACTDILCFGPPDTSTDELPAGILSPHRIASGVVNGVRDYGNKMGIPTVNGAILYHQGYMYNPLVFCGCLGVLPHGSHPRQVQPGDKIVVLGGRTGRDGIHGATFSSGEMSSEINAQAGSAVQIGAPITEKKVADVIIQARDRQLYTAVTDCGAGGFSSAIGEMGARTGAYVELEKAPLKYQSLTPWEIWLSEAQERMVLAVPPQHLEELLEICAIEEVEASIIGLFTGDHRLVVSYAGQAVADIDMEFLHEGRPGKTLEAVWTRKVPEWDKIPRAHTSTYMRDDRGATHYAPTLLALLRHPTIASKEAVVRRYDFEVQGATVLKPLVGRAGNGPGDATVLQPLFAEQTNMGIVLSNGINPLYGRIDPYHMAINAVDEALRNLTAVGGNIERAALLDNFCWGNPNDPEQSGILVRAVKGCHDAAIGFGTPFISGKDSLNNEYRTKDQRLPVIPTLLISAVGIIDNAAQTIDMSLKHPGNLLYLIGQTHNELAASHYALSSLIPNTTVPHVNPQTARTTMRAIGHAIRSGIVQSCHDLSEGGLAVAAAEMSLAGLLGLSIDIDQVPHVPDELRHQPPDLRNTILLFSESASRFLVEVSPGQKEAFEDHMRAHAVNAIACIGSVTHTGRFEVRNGAQHLIDLTVSDLQAAWKG